MEGRETPHAEKRAYLVDGRKVADDWNSVTATDEEFKDEAEKQGLVYSLDGFAKAFNSTREINPIYQHIRIL